MQEAEVTEETGKCQSPEGVRQTKRPHSEGTGGREREGEMGGSRGGRHPGNHN